MITGVAPRYQAHRNFSGAPLRRSAAWRASQTAHRRALEELRRRDLCPKATSGLVGAGRTGRRVWAGQHACGACAMARPLPHVTRRYGRVPSKVKLWITTSVTRQIPAAGPRATAPGTVTWTYASRPSPETSRAAEPEHKLTAVFDDPNLISVAGLAPLMALAERAGLHELVAEHVTVPGS